MRSKSDILDDLLQQARSSRDGFDNQEVDEVDIDTADISSSSLLDHLLNKAMKEKVSRDSDSFRPEAIYQDQVNSDHQDENFHSSHEDDASQKSRFKYLFFEILTPDEYNDIIYLGEDLLEPMEESVAIIDDKAKTESSSQPKVDYQLDEVKEQQYVSNLNPVSTTNQNEYKKTYQQADERKTKMESLLKRMTERYKIRTKESSHDSKEEIKTQKLKSMIDILEDKLYKYDNKDANEKKISSRRIDSGPSYAEKLAARGIQRTRTTPSSSNYNSKYSKFSTTAKPQKNQEEVKEKWNQAMDELSDKLKRMSSGVHRINLDEMLDLDMLEVPEDDQASSNSYIGTTAVPPSDSHKPKRQIHPKLTYQRPDFVDIHRPSSKLKDLIREKVEFSQGTPSSVIKSLPPISRYHDQEPVYKPSNQLSSDECPYIPKRPYTECYNAPPSECQNIGYPDNSCSAGAICCYDGCINLCWKNPNLPPKLPPLSPPPSQYEVAGQHYPSSTTPPPKVYGYTLEPEVHSASNLPPKMPDYSTPSHISADIFRTTPSPYGAGRQEYIPPSEGVVPSTHHSSTAYPPPSKYYKQPSISFVAKGETGGASYSTMTPPSKEYYKEAKALDYSSHMQKYKPPGKEYLPPSVKSTPASVHHSTPAPNHVHMSTYAPPNKEYLPPSPSSTIKPNHVHMSTYSPPSKEYVPPSHSTTIKPSHLHMSTYAPPSKEYLPPSPSSTIKPPSTSYLPPHSTTKPNYKDVLTKGYIPPANLVHDAVHKGTPQAHYMSTTYAPPTKNYLPPQKSTVKPDNMQYMAPPEKKYFPPEHMSHMHAPEKGYIPPDYMSHMQPPEKHYIPPKHMSHIIPPEKSYIPPDHMSHIHPPEKQYIPPDHAHMTPPAKEYIPPDHMSHIHPPGKQYIPPKKMNYMSPPEKNYIPPEHMSHLAPPEKNYLPPKHMSHISPPDKKYLPPESTQPEPDYMTHMEPPRKSYIPPDAMSHMEPPSKSYIPPDSMKSMHPPSKEYIVPDHMYKMYAPEKNYAPPHHMSQLVPPKETAHYTVCPHFTLKEKIECPVINHQCWSPGVPDEDCPDYGLCCFDGCNNVCLDPSTYKPSGYHVPKHNAHLVPGHEYVPSEDHENLSHFKHRTLHAPSKEYLPPPDAVYHLVDESPVEYENNLPSSYLPPKKEYLPPHKSTARPDHMAPPVKEYIPPDHMSHYTPPEKEYLPPSTKYSSSPHDEHNELTSYEPPKHGYLPPIPEPKHSKSHSTAYELPKHEYLPPSPNPKHSPPKDEKHPYASYLPPSKEYIPPAVHHDAPVKHYDAYSTTEGKIFF